MLVFKVIQDFFKEKEKQTGKTNIFDPMNMVPFSLQTLFRGAII